MVRAISKRWWQSRTIWLGLLELTIGLLDVFAESGLTDESADGVLLMIAGMLTVLLRFVTRLPVERPYISRPHRFDSWR